MAIDGGGPPVGIANSFTGTAQALEIYGDFAAGYSGNIPATTSQSTMLSFTTGSHLFVGDLVCNGHNNATAAGTGVVASLFFVKLNGAVVSMMKVETAGEKAPTQCFTTLVIPPYSVVEITTLAQDDESDRFATAVLTGRIYRD
tara:strand:- start:245 stop:676 length:432 start_codon:yes stop_codon:yes gene_type:complete